MTYIDEQLQQVLLFLSRRDAIKILNASIGGINSGTRTRKLLGLSQKRYYTRLNELIKASLIEKVNSKYEITMLGKLCLQMVEILSDALSQSKRLDLLTRIGRLEGITIDQMESIAKILSNIDIEGMMVPVKMCDTWTSVVETTNSYLERAEETIHFATKYFDHRTVESIIMAIQRGVKFRSLIDKHLSIDIKNRVKLLGSMLSHPRMFKLFYNFVRSAKEISRYVDLPYTFFVIDGRYASIEISNPVTNHFYVGFFFHHTGICKKLLENFEMLWEKGTIMDGLM